MTQDTYDRFFGYVLSLKYLHPTVEDFERMLLLPLLHVMSSFLDPTPTYPAEPFYEIGLLLYNGDHDAARALFDEFRTK